MGFRMTLHPQHPAVTELSETVRVATHDHNLVKHPLLLLSPDQIMISASLGTELALSNVGSSFLATLVISLASVVAILFIPVGAVSTVPGSTKRPKLLDFFLAFACGTMLGDVLLHILPELLEEASHAQVGHHHHHQGDDARHDHGDHSHMHLLPPMLTVICGLLFFFLVETVVHHLSGGDHHHHHGGSDDHKHASPEPLPKEVVVKRTTRARGDETAQKRRVTRSQDGTLPKRPVGDAHRTSSQPKPESNVVAPADTDELPHIRPAAYLNLIADAVHNFGDGLAVGAAFMVSGPTGVSSAIAVFFHELPQEIGDYCVLLASGMSRRQAILLNFLSAATAMLGNLVVVVVGLWVKNALPWIMAFAAGGFLYISLVDILPELQHSLVHERKASLSLALWGSFKVVLPFLVGVGLMVFLSYLE